MSSAICFDLDQSKIWLSGNGLSIQPSKDFFRHLVLKDVDFTHYLEMFSKLSAITWLVLLGKGVRHVRWWLR